MQQPPAQPYVLVLSRLHPKKRLEVLIDAFLQLVEQSQFREWRLVLAGDGPGDYSKDIAKQSVVRSGERICLVSRMAGRRIEKLSLQRAFVVSSAFSMQRISACVSWSH